MDFHQYSKKIQDDDLNEEEIIEESMDDYVIEQIDPNDKQLIEQVKSHSCIYKNKRKKNQNEINQAWLNIAQILNSKVEDCQHRWKILRQRYCKQRQARESKQFQSNYPEKLSLYHFMSWIDPYIPRRRKIDKNFTAQGKSKATKSNVNKSMLNFTDSVNIGQADIDESLVVLNPDSIKASSQPVLSQNIDSTNNAATSGNVNLNISSEKDSCMTQNIAECDLYLNNEFTATTNFTISSAEEESTTIPVSRALDTDSTTVFNNDNVSEIIPHTSGSTINNNDVYQSESTMINNQEKELHFHEECRNTLADITFKVNNALNSKFSQTPSKSSKTFNTLGELVEDNLRNIEDQTQTNKLKLTKIW